MRSLAFVFVLASITVVGSERMFWFWASEPLPHVELSAFYAIATGAAVMLMRRFHVTSMWSLLLVSPVVAYVVEGVITPVMYSGGPMVPVFPAWFAFWHGILAFVGLGFGLRSLMLRSATGRVAAAAIGLGAFWGLWSSTLRLPENVNDEELIADGGALVVLEPGAFAVYAVTFTAILMASHWAAGFVWPRPISGQPARRRLGPAEWLVASLCLVMVVAWTFVLPWALPMFLAYVALQVVGLRWHRRSLAEPLPPSLFDQLRGRLPIRSLLPLALMAPAAAATYLIVWTLDPSDVVLRVMMYSIIAGQGLAGFGITVAALGRSRRKVSGSGDSGSSSRFRSSAV